jgi:hypothetical protein
MDDGLHKLAQELEWKIGKYSPFRLIGWLRGGSLVMTYDGFAK